MLGMGVWLTAELLQDWLTYPSYTELSSEFTNEYYLPAITICNINLMNKTKMEEDKIEVAGKRGFNTTVSVYKLFQDLQEKHQDRSSARSVASKDLPYERIDSMHAQQTYSWNIRSTLDLQSFTFAKEVLPANRESDYLTIRFTEMGSCLEVNDQEILVQRVNGRIGGLSMILDTRTEHYLESTETEGFFVLLRMPNETVLNKEYAFAVSPGKETFVQLQTTEITRLEPRHGTCKNEEDVFKSSARSTTDKKEETKEGINMDDTLTVKECFRNQVLWQYMREPLCKCYPWYIYTRHINPPPTRDTELEHHIYQYFTQGISQEKRIEFDNSTCYYQDQFSYSGTSLKTLPSISSAVLCAEQCKQTDNCVYLCGLLQVNKKQNTKKSAFCLTKQPF
ncbi:acid-sensing ion channel 1A-like [Bolinopsis microptera]|uniref:acid-sensing ion channel 1A-like n=1 Tax=Bolinopsis microptera TaxID=2820187 RepID=UPI0030794AF9